MRWSHRNKFLLEKLHTLPHAHNTHARTHLCIHTGTHFHTFIAHIPKQRDTYCTSSHPHPSRVREREEKERETETKTESERETETESERERQRQKVRDREWKRRGKIERENERGRETPSAYLLVVFCASPLQQKVKTAKGFFILQSWNCVLPE